MVEDALIEEGCHGGRTLVGFIEEGVVEEDVVL
jgi:hypothetical protein